MAKVWITGGNLSQARVAITGFGIQSSGVAAGGDNGDATDYNITEEYNGSSW